MQHNFKHLDTKAFSNRKSQRIPQCNTLENKKLGLLPRLEKVIAIN